MAASPSSGMSETTPPHTAGPAPEISTADALKKGDEALHRKDYARALHWYRQAADQGVLEAQNNIGRLYANGWGVTQDYSEAMRWFRRAADQGYAGADYNVGLLYERGWGVAQDYGEAMRWYRQAADQRNAFAQLNIGRLYYFGRGVPQNLRRDDKLVPQGCGPGECCSAGEYWMVVRARRRRGAGLQRGASVVPQGCGAQVVRLGHRGTPSVRCSDEVAISRRPPHSISRSLDQQMP